MAAFKNPVDALAFAACIQHDLFDAKWPTEEEINSFYIRQIPVGVSRRVSFQPLQPPSEQQLDHSELWNGLRVRVGIHYGCGQIHVDETTRGYDYFGTVVNTAARVEGVGHGGQMLISAEMYEEYLNRLQAPLRRPSLADLLFISLGRQPLRGLPEPIELYQVTPMRFHQRRFPALRLDMENALAEELLDKGSSKGKNSSSKVNRSESSPSLSAQRKVGDEGSMTSARSVGSDYERSLNLVRAMISHGDFQSQARLIEGLASQWENHKRTAKRGLADISERHSHLLAEAVGAAYRAINVPDSYGPTPVNLKSPKKPLPALVSHDDVEALVFNQLPPVTDPNDVSVLSNGSGARARPASVADVKNGFGSSPQPPPTQIFID
eukprot:GILK01018688.1.p1 GENE.GILK01018688.1~~GILK01018688.1.p1  ORF type:complete len:391 (-),score=12.82 GILK01018688.1:151-1290(-)